MLKLKLAYRLFLGIILFASFIDNSRIIEPALGASNNVDSLKIKLQSPIWTERISAAEQIATVQDTALVIDIIAEAISAELEQPVSLEYSRVGSYASNSEIILQKYNSILMELGPNTLPVIKELALTSPRDLRHWLISIIALKGDTSVHQEVRDIISSNENRWVRGMAVAALAAYQDKKDVPWFQMALNDTNSVLVVLDVLLEDESRAITYVYPIRESAIRALKILGYVVIKDKDGNFALKQR